MRLPKIRQLTEAQKQVYLYAPNDKHVLVQGPPGTGKTIIACFRALELHKRGVPAVLGMFSRVLTRYSSNAGQGVDLPSQTVHAWFREWWARSGVPPHSAADPQIAVEAPFAQKDDVKSAGAKWNPHVWRPWGGGKGIWSIDSDAYASNPGAFSRWRLWHSPPVIDGNPNRIDWNAVADHVVEHEEIITDESLNLGALLIDEGQDFAPAFYKTLYRISAIALMRGGRVAHPPRCFVLADENQQLTEDNSTLDDIATELKIAPAHRYVLLDNFRNTKEIAELARAFFSDVGVLPNLPTRTGERPSMSLVESHTQVARRVKTWMTNNPGKEVGVLVFDDGTRASMVEAIEKSVQTMRGRQITVQTYSWKTRADTRVSDLLFDIPDVVTVLNLQSCKGLEFDAVFIVDPHRAQIAAYGGDRFKMQMFVAISRARDWVELVDSGPAAGTGPWLEYLPGDELIERPAGEGSSAVKSMPKKPPARATLVPPAGGGDDGLALIVAEAGRRSWATEDRRADGGAFWVYADRKFASLFEPQGFTYAERRAGWWRK